MQCPITRLDVLKGGADEGHGRAVKGSFGKFKLSIEKRNSTKMISHRDNLALINMAKQHNQTDNLVLVDGLQSTGDQDDNSSLTITDLPTLSQLRDSEEVHQRQHAACVQILEHPQLRLDVP